MIRQELLRDSTESYLKSLISDVSGSLSSDFDSDAPFGELGIVGAESANALNAESIVDTPFTHSVNYNLPFSRFEQDGKQI